MLRCMNPSLADSVAKVVFAPLITKFLSRRRVFHVRMWGSHDLALTSPVTSVIRLESPLLAVLACLGFSQKIIAHHLAIFATLSVLNRFAATSDMRPFLVA